MGPRGLLGDPRVQHAGTGETEVPRGDGAGEAETILGPEDAEARGRKCRRARLRLLLLSPTVHITLPCPVLPLSTGAWAPPSLGAGRGRGGVDVPSLLPAGTLWFILLLSILSCALENRGPIFPSGNSRLPTLPTCS